jgi:hypothetical protein
MDRWATTKTHDTRNLGFSLWRFKKLAAQHIKGYNVLAESNSRFGKESSRPFTYERGRKHVDMGKEHQQ